MKKARKKKAKAGTNGKTSAQKEAAERNNEFYKELLPYLDATVDYLVTDQPDFSIPLVLGTLTRFCNLVDKSEVTVKTPKGVDLP